MAQFDVHRNRGRSHDSIPFVVIVQSSLFDDYRRRVAVPLVDKSRVGPITNPRLNPIFRIKGTSVFLHPLEIVPIERDQLGELVGSLRDESDRVIAALDELLIRA